MEDDGVNSYRCMVRVCVCVCMCVHVCVYMCAHVCTRMCVVQRRGNSDVTMRDVHTASVH